MQKRLIAVAVLSLGLGGMAMLGCEDRSEKGTPRQQPQGTSQRQQESTGAAQQAGQPQPGTPTPGEQPSTQPSQQTPTTQPGQGESDQPNPQ